MRKLYWLAMKFIMIAVMVFTQSCTFTIAIPEIKVTTTTTNEEPKGYDISEAYKSVGMVAMQPVGSALALGIGTAFAINDTTLLTAGHVCVAVQEIQLSGRATKDLWLVRIGRTDELSRRSGLVIKNIDTVTDICEIEFKNHGLQPLKVADYNSLKFGDKTFIVGAPSGIMVSISEGQVMNKMTSGLPDPIANGRLAISSAATGGHSGSPILNDRGELIGILVSGHRTYDHLSFGVPMPTVSKFMDKFKINWDKAY